MIGVWSKLRQIEFMRHPERICVRNRCLGVAHECPNPVKRNTL